MNIAELLEEASARKVQDGNSAFYVIERRFGRPISDLNKMEFLKVIRKIREDCLLWCDDMISFANEDV